MQTLIAVALVFALALSTTIIQAQTAPKLKMTTDIPPQITTPDSVETRLGTLKFFDGFPDDATVERVYDNPDTSVDIWFGPTAPAGHESNWVQTVPGKGWNTILRLYGPLQPWFDKTWKPGEIKLVK